MAPTFYTNSISPAEGRYIDLDETAPPQLELWIVQALAHNQELCPHRRIPFP